MAERTATVTIGTKTYMLVAMTPVEQVRAKLLGLGFSELQRKGPVSDEVVNGFNQIARQIVQVSVSRADPAVSIEELTHAEVLVLMKKLFEISIAANVFDPLTGPVQ
jgi:hypothetical protein